MFYFLKIMDKYEAKVLRIHLGPRANAIIASPEGFEKVLSSNKQITKVRYLSFSLTEVSSRDGCQADWSTSMSRTVPRNCFASSLMP